MRLALRILFLASFLGSLLGIYSTPKDIKLYLAAIAAVAALLGTFRESEKKEARIVPRLILRPHLRDGKPWDLHYLVIHNNGDHEIRDFMIKVVTRPEQRSPFLEDEKEEGVLRYSVIHPDQKFESPMSLAMDNGVEFDFEWSWTSARGRKEERKGIVKLEG
ncbi:MAG TPA: hypothetical protein VHO24_00830 [Opitutaceae bacterium]|nr:hypothetical protein [Opitutaceae bacterium]